MFQIKDKHQLEEPEFGKLFDSIRIKLFLIILKEIKS